MTPKNHSPEDRARHVWSIGSYPAIAPHFLPMAGNLVHSTEIGPGDTTLDVACGTGNVAITAARRGARVTGLDLVPAMLERAMENAATAGVEGIAWKKGSATELPFSEDAFDATLSSVGHIFADPPHAAGRELVRVTRPGGRIGFTSWTPDSVVPAMGRVLNDYLPPAPNRPDPPFLWGNPDVVEERLGNGVDDLVFETHTVAIPVFSPAHYWEKAATDSGMFIVALEAVDQARHAALREEMLSVVEEYFDERRNVIPMEYRIALARATGAG